MARRKHLKLFLLIELKETSPTCPYTFGEFMVGVKPPYPFMG